MRRQLGILIILLAVSFGLVTAGVVKLEKTAKQVTVEEINRFGDKSAAEGLHLSLPVGVLDGRLSWNTEVVIGQEALAETVHQRNWSAKQDVWRLSEEEGASINIDIYGNESINESYFIKNNQGEGYFIEAAELSEIYEAVEEGSLPEETNYHKVFRKTVMINDVYEFYPLFVEGIVTERNLYREAVLNGDVPATMMNEREYTDTVCFSDYGYWPDTAISEGPVKNLCDGIKYRLWPEYPLPIEATVYKNLETDYIESFSCQPLLEETWVEEFGSSVGKKVLAYSVSEATETDIYYAVDLRLRGGGRPRAETFESGYGVWRIGCRVYDEQGSMVMEFTETVPELICEIDPEEMLLELVCSEDQKEMYLFTARDGVCFLSVIDLQAKIVAQKMEIFRGDPQGLLEIKSVIKGEKLLIVQITEEIPEEIIRESEVDVMVVVAADNDGMYEAKFAMDRAEEFETEAYRYLEDTYWSVTHWTREPVSVEAAFQDGKLAMVYSLTNSYGNDAGSKTQLGTGCFWLAVYDETGMIYAGDYRISLGMTEYEQEEICDIRDDVEIGISWGE